MKFVVFLTAFAFVVIGKSETKFDDWCSKLIFNKY